jgi:hypothetical protein
MPDVGRSASYKETVMFRPLILAALIVIPGIAAAQTSEGGKPPQRIRSVSLKTGEKCPTAASDEIVVCSTLDQPYRIPKTLRNDGPIKAKNQSWVNRTATMDQVGRQAGGLPDTCSPVGTGGQSGCSLAANQAWAAERRAQRDANSTVP